MKRLIFLILLPVFAWAKNEGPKFTASENGCLVFANLNTSKKLEAYGENCGIRSQPCSTFKIALAEMAFKHRKINSKGEQFKWDRIVREREALNKDQDLLSWMKDSVVWVSSVIADRMGRDEIRKELEKLKYGNALIGPNEFWIKGPLAISVHEQMKYLSRQKNTDHLEQALQLLPIVKVGNFSVSGKTGSCYLENTKQEIGWYVGRATSAAHSHAFALRFIKNENQKAQEPAGLRAKKLFMDWLEKHLLP
jgi:beta-lactamase class D